MKDIEKLIQGLKSCIMDEDCIPTCKECPYGIDGEKWENNRTAERCNDVLKKDLLLFLEKSKQLFDKGAHHENKN